MSIKNFLSERAPLENDFRHLNIPSKNQPEKSDKMKSNRVSKQPKAQLARGGNETKNVAKTSKGQSVPDVPSTKSDSPGPSAKIRMPHCSFTTLPSNGVVPLCCSAELMQMSTQNEANRETCPFVSIEDVLNTGKKNSKNEKLPDVRSLPSSSDVSSSGRKKRGGKKRGQVKRGRVKRIPRKRSVKKRDPNKDLTSKCSEINQRRPDFERIYRLAHPKNKNMKFLDLKPLFDDMQKKEHERWLRQTQSDNATVRVGELAVPYPKTIKITRARYCAVMNDTHYNNLTDAYAKSVYLYGVPPMDPSQKRLIVDHPSFDDLKMTCDTFYTRHRKKTKLYQQMAAKSLLAHIASQMNSQKSFVNEPSKVSIVKPDQTSATRIATGPKNSTAASHISFQPQPSHQSLTHPSMLNGKESLTKTNTDEIITLRGPKNKTESRSAQKLRNDMGNSRDSRKSVHSTIGTNPSGTTVPTPPAQTNEVNSLMVIKDETQESLAGPVNSAENMEYGKVKFWKQKNEPSTPKTNALQNLLSCFSKPSKPSSRKAKDKPSRSRRAIDRPSRSRNEEDKPGSPKNAEDRPKSPRSSALKSKSRTGSTRSKQSRGGKLTVMHAGIASSNDIKRFRLSNSTKNALVHMSNKDPEYFDKFFKLNTASLVAHQPQYSLDSLDKMDMQINMLSEQLNGIAENQDSMVKMKGDNKEKPSFVDRPLTTGDLDFFNQIINLDSSISPVPSYVDSSNVQANVPSKPTKPSQKKSICTKKSTKSVGFKKDSPKRILQPNRKASPSNVDKPQRKFQIYNASAKAEFRPSRTPKDQQTSTIVKDKELSSNDDNSLTSSANECEYNGAPEEINDVDVQMSYEDEILALRRQVAKFRRDRTFARLAQPRVVTAGESKVSIIPPYFYYTDVSKKQPNNPSRIAQQSQKNPDCFKTSTQMKGFRNGSSKRILQANNKTSPLNVDKSQRNFQIYNASANVDYRPKDSRILTNREENELSSSSLSSSANESEFYDIHKKAMLVQKSFEDENLARQRQDAKTRRDKAFARLAQPRYVTEKRVETIASCPDMMGFKKKSPKRIQHSNNKASPSNVDKPLRKFQTYNASAIAGFRSNRTSKDQRCSTIVEDDELTSSSMSSSENECEYGENPDEINYVDKKAMLLQMSYEDEILARRRQEAETRRDNTFARLAQPRVVNPKRLEAIASCPDMTSIQRKLSFKHTSERLKQLAVPRCFRETVKRDPEEQTITASQRFQINRKNRADKLAAIQQDRLKLIEARRLHDRYPQPLERHNQDICLENQRSRIDVGYSNVSKSRIEVGDASVLKTTASDTLIQLTVYVND